MAGVLSDKEKESFPSRSGDNVVQPNTKHHNKCVKRLEYSMRRSAPISLVMHVYIFIDTRIYYPLIFCIHFADPYVKFMLEAMEKVGW